MGQVTDLVDEHRAAVAAGVFVRAEHEVVEEQLPARIEEVEQARLPVRPVENVVLVDPDHRQPATLGRERVSCPGGVLFLGKERFPRCLPFLLGDDRGKVHRAPLILIECKPPGSVRPGTVAGDTATQIPRATRAIANAGASRSPGGRTFSVKIANPTTAIQKRLIAPSANRTAIRAPEQPTQSRPCASPLRNASPPYGALRQRPRLRRFNGVSS